MHPTPRPRNRLALWYEQTRWPGLALCVVVLLLYAWSLPWGFVIDDHRHVAHCREVREGMRDSLGLYRFLHSDEENRRLRREGYQPWWLSDDVRYQHLRPLSERMLYAEYLLFGGRPWGYRAVSIALYCIGCVLVLRVFRLLTRDERVARWTALIFTLGSAHALPVVFISMKCDLLSLVLVAAAMVAGGRFVESGGVFRAMVCAALYAVSLGAKESGLPAAVLPLCAWLAMREIPGAARRATGLTLGLSAIGCFWIGVYAIGGYGSNTSLILDPFHSTGAYLAALPVRVLQLLCTWVIVVNPFIFYLRPAGETWLIVLGVLGSTLLAIIGAIIWRHHRSQRGVASAALWVLPFLPLLACTIPDDRNMMLPGVGLSLFAGVWLTRTRDGDAAGALRPVPLVMFVLGQIPTVLVISGIFRFVELDSRGLLHDALAALGRPARSGDCLFFVNDARDWQVLFAQYSLEGMDDTAGVRAAFLSDLQTPRLRRTGPRTLRIDGDGQPFMEGFLGAMSTSRERPKRPGDEFDAGEFTARIAEMDGRRVMTVDMTFRDTLDCERYRFLYCRRGEPPERLAMPVAQGPVAINGPR